MTGQIVEEAENLKRYLKVRFAGKSTAYADGAIRIAHALLVAEVGSARTAWQNCRQNLDKAIRADGRGA